MLDGVEDRPQIMQVELQEEHKQNMIQEIVGGGMQQGVIQIQLTLNIHSTGVQRRQNPREILSLRRRKMELERGWPWILCLQEEVVRIWIKHWC